LTAFLNPSELRIGLGCMRLSEPETIAAAAEAGITVFDTARAYEGNEQLVAGTLRRCGAEAKARIVTKGGMARPAGAWVPDGRAKAILADCEASLAALDGMPIDLYLIHAPDPRMPWRTSVRALARLVDEGMVRRVGVSNVNRAQLEEALELAPIAAIEVALSVFDDHALRGGVVEKCEASGVAVIAHSPLGGPRRAQRLGAEQALLALAWLLELSPDIIVIPGARRPETARAAASAATLALGDADRAALEQAFGALRPARVERRHPSGDGEVVLVMGIPGAGKSRIAEDFVARGYVRLNRDERGGSLRELAAALERELAAGARRVVLDNTYLTRAARSYVIDAADRQGLPVRCIWLDTPLAQAQVNIVERLLDGDEVLAPTSQMRALRELEPPADDEGWAAVETMPFVRAVRTGRAGVFVAAEALDALQHSDPDAPHLVFDWQPGAAADALAPAVARLAAQVSGPVEGAVCPHPAGPPSCWCRPPLPMLILAFARAHQVDPSRSTLIGTSAAHRSLAATLGARWISAPPRV
jgi:aryl-alcohol dehydrogenase-like predicted oxidoreductase/predicted kinase